MRWQFRIADGALLDFEDPAPRGHSIEFRINGEDPGRGFLPAPGAVTKWAPPLGPGVRTDTGIEAGSVIGGQFDSLLAKIIVTGATRTEAIERSRRALDEIVVEGMATALPFHQAVVRDPAFAPTDAEPPSPSTTGGSRPSSTTPSRRSPAAPTPRTRPTSASGSSSRSAASGSRSCCPAGLGVGSAPAAVRPRRRSRPASARPAAPPQRPVTALTSPMQGTIVKVAVADGDTVAAGDMIVVLEAMKMEQPLTAHKAGTVTGLTAAVGATVTSGAVICEIKE